MSGGSPNRNTMRNKNRNNNSTRKHGGGVKIVVMTRFSVYSHGSSMLKNTQKNIKNDNTYLSRIYDPARLDAKMKAFKNITLPSILSQSYKNLVWNIYTSPQLPEKYMNMLKGLIKDPRIHLKIVNNMDQANGDYGRQLKKYSKYISVRLDDDDGLHPQYFKLLAKSYKPGQILNPSHGLKITLSDKEPGKMICTKFTRTFAASGLAYANGNVISIGNHTKVHEKFDKSKITTFPHRELTLFTVHGFNLSKATIAENSVKMTRPIKEYMSQTLLKIPV